MGVMVSLDVFHRIIEVSAAEHVRSILPWGWKDKELFLPAARAKQVYKSLFVIIIMFSAIIKKELERANTHLHMAVQC